MQFSTYGLHVPFFIAFSSSERAYIMSASAPTASSSGAALTADAPASLASAAPCARESVTIAFGLKTALTVLSQFSLNVYMLESKVPAHDVVTICADCNAGSTYLFAGCTKLRTCWTGSFIAFVNTARQEPGPVLGPLANSLKKVPHQAQSMLPPPPPCWRI